MNPMLRLIGGALCASLAFAALAQPTTRESVSTGGVQGNGNSLYPSLSADGRFVAFDSLSNNFVSDLNFRVDAFVRDRATNQTTRVSVASGGGEGNGNAETPSISADGRFVAFQGSSTNIVAADTNNAFDVFVHDRQTTQTTRVSVSSTGAQANFDSRGISISPDGNSVVFESGASNLVAGDSNSAQDVFVHDRASAQTTRVSVSSTGAQGNGPSGGEPLSTPRLSADGRYVAFQSTASNLVSGDTAGSDVFVHDRLSGQTTRVSVSSTGVGANNDARYASISADGRYVAFASAASNLVAGDNNGVADVFVHDRQTGVTVRASVAADGTQANAFSALPAISGNGRVVVFWSLASNLVPGDVNGAFSDVFARNLQTGETTLVSIASNGDQGNNDSREPAVSFDGRFVAFQSRANTLVPVDTNGVDDVFVRDRSDGAFADSFE